MASTITNFYTFVDNTPAVAGEVNANFSNFRGDIIPVEPLTIAASNVTHDLGTTDHRWRNGYISELYLGQTTTSFRIGDQAASVGALTFYIGNTAFYRTEIGTFKYLNTAGTYNIFEMSAGAIRLAKPNTTSASFRAGSDKMEFFSSAGSALFSIDASSTFYINNYSTGNRLFYVDSSGTVNEGPIHQKFPGASTNNMNPTTTVTSFATFDLSVAAGTVPNGVYVMGFQAVTANTHTSIQFQSPNTTAVSVEFQFRYNTTTGGVVYHQRFAQSGATITGLEIPTGSFMTPISQLTSGSYTLKFMYKCNPTVTANGVGTFAKRIS